jgi:molybdopterin synthase catalytic subunit
MLKEMRPGTVIVDVAVDQGGCVETTRPTTHEDPVYIIDDVVHYSVANMPGAVPCTSTMALTNVTLAYVLKLAALGWKVACDKDASLKKGLNIIAGAVVYKEINEAFHDIFLGQVRADVINDKTVVAIEYSAYEEMANQEFHTIREMAFKKFDLTCMHIYHSKGIVKAGELCLFVFTSSAHRQEAMDACRYLVEEIKLKVPIFGKEIFEDGAHVWKKNS